MVLTTSLFVIAFAGLLHASFQLGVSVLSLLSGHSLGTRRSYKKLMQLNVAYLFGASVITILLFSGLAYLTLLVLGAVSKDAWLIFSILNMIIGVAVMIFYYRREKGTGLWIPRAMATYLTNRTKKTHHPAEAFTLGVGSVLAEVPFLIGPLSLAILYAITQTDTSSQLSSLILYVLVSLFPLFVIVGLIGAGHKVSTIQRWREENKLFLQYCAGSGIIILGAFVFVNEYLGANI